VRLTDGEEIIIDDIAVVQWPSGATELHRDSVLRGGRQHSVSI